MSGIVGGAGSKSGVIGTTELDYEEGEWTASLTAATPLDSVPTAAGHYRLVGGICHFNIRRFSGFSTSGGSGAIRITGLPFAPTTSCIVGGSMWTYNMSFNTSNYICFEMDAGDSTLWGKEGVNGAAWVNWDIGSTGSNRYVSLSGSYIIN